MGQDFVKAPCQDGYDFKQVIPATYSNAGLNYKSMIVESVDLKGKYVEEAIGEKYFWWSCWNPIFIDAPTGSGKSTFVCHKLIADAKKSNRTLLLVSNRAALVRQQKKKVIEAACPEINLSELDDNTIDEYKFWGNVCICTYHGLMALVNKAKIYQELKNFLDLLMYAVFDEVHFLYADSTFASSTEELLKFIPAWFYNVIRVYMTATSNSILSTLQNAERLAQQTLSNTPNLVPFGHPTKAAIPGWKFRYYRMPRDYSRYQLHFFFEYGTDEPLSTENMENMSKKGRQGKLRKELASLMSCVPKPTPENKLLVFVRRRKDGIALENAWLEKGVDAIFIDRTSKFAPTEISDVEMDEEDDEEDSDQEKQLQKNDVWNKLIREEKFDQSVLLATSVLDCGINICDSSVKNVAIFADDPTAFLQMLGRRRMSEAENLDVWVYVPRSSNFTKLARMKEQEIKLAERLSCIRNHQTQVSTFHNGPLVPHITKIDGKLNTEIRDNIQELILQQHCEELEYDFADSFPGENYRGFYYKLWNSYSKIGDKRLFYFDTFGQLYVDYYVLWVVREQQRYYNRLAISGDFRLQVAHWMGKDQELLNKRAEKKKELCASLKKHLTSPITLDERDDIRFLIMEAALLHLENHSLGEDWRKMMPKTLNPILDALDIPYMIVRDSTPKSKNWIVKLQEEFKEK